MKNNCYYEFGLEYTVKDAPPKPNSILRFQRKHPGYSNHGVTETKVSFSYAYDIYASFKRFVQTQNE